MDPEQPVPGSATTRPSPSSPDAAIDAFLAAGPGPETGSSLLSAELRQLGGVLGREGAG